jgi:Tol biopolymer transport system component
MGMKRTVLLLASMALAMLLTSGAALVAMLAIPEEAEAAFPGKNGQIGGEGRWSPDGTKVVFSRLENEYDPDSSEIYIKDVATGQTTQLTNDSNFCDGGIDQGEGYCPRGQVTPAWSPDGSKVAFVSIKDPLNEHPEYQINVINTDGSDRKVLTRGSYISHLAWSPDGNQIAYNTWWIDYYAIFVIGANGTNKHPLYTPPSGELYEDGPPAWSPDSKQVLFAVERSDSEGSFVDNAIWKVNADGSNLTRLVETDRDVTFLPELWYTWAPDGTKIAYEKGGEIWTMKPDGSAQTDTNTSSGFSTFDWQPLCSIKGTSSNDTLTGTSAKDIICGMGGNDQIKGLAGADVLLGGEGNDTLSGGTGNDRIFGGLGTDTASYQSSTTAVRASMTEEGATGEGTDTFMTLDNLTGSALADELIGSPGANVLRGAGGPDILRGRGANDTLAGDAGADQHYGENGDDTLNSIDGVKGNDSLSGGADTDTCFKDATEKSVIYCEQ